MRIILEKLSFVIPCYYSEKTIANVVGRIIKTVKNDGRYDYEIICVNDGSKDGSYAALKVLVQENKKIKALNLSRNYGQHAALMAGFHFVTGDIVVCLDDDGETSPEYMFRLIDKLQEGYDLVSAKYREDNRNFIRNIGSKVSFAMSRTLIHQPKDIELNSYYVFRRYIRDEIIKYDNPYPFVHGLILRVTRNMANVELPRDQRIDGKSGYNFRKLFSLWMNGFTAFSEKPLRIVSMVGMLFSVTGFIFLVIIILRKMFNPAIAIGYTSTMAVLVFIGGVLMIFLGLIGEYIARIYISINKAPQFVVRDACNIDTTE